jgi:hypothetical protein
MSIGAVNVLISGGFSSAYERLLPEFERTSGIKVTTRSNFSPRRTLSRQSGKVEWNRSRPPASGFRPMDVAEFHCRAPAGPLDLIARVYGVYEWAN